MANNYIDKIEVNGEVRDIQDAGARQSLKNAVHPNLLINGDFRDGCLVDQRQGRISLAGTTVYTDEACTTIMGTQTESAATCVKSGDNYARWISGVISGYVKAEDVVRGYVGGYGIDMWGSVTGTTVSISDEGLAIHSPTGSALYIYQFIENHSVLKGKKLTMSCLFSGGANTKYSEVVCYNSGSPGYVIFAGNVISGAGLSSISFVVPDDTTRIECRAVAPWGTTEAFNLVACKLELGDTQTLAHQDSAGNWVLNEVPLYADTLARCQRYFQRIKASSGYMRFGVSQPYTSALAGVIVPLLCEMRTTPIIAISGSFALFDGASIYEVALTLDTAAPYNVTLKAAGTGLPSVSAQLLANGDINAYIDLSAEL